MIRPNWFTDDEWNALIEQGRRTAAGETNDPVPLVRLRTPDNDWSWLIYEIDPEDDDVAYALCDLGLRCPEEGMISLSDLSRMLGPALMHVERDIRYKPSPDLPLSRLARMASETGRIIV